MSVNGSLLWRTWIEEAWGMWAGEPSLVHRLRPLLLSAYVFSILLSMLGNLLVVVVFIKLHCRPSALRAYQLNLAAADLSITLLCVPFTLSQVLTDKWIFGSLLCPLILFLQSVSVIVSSYTNVAIAIDRFYAVYFPIRSRVTTKNYRKTMLCVWGLAAVLSSPQFGVGRTTYMVTNQNNSVCLCNEQWSGEGHQQGYTLTFFTLVFLLPLGVVFFAYTCIARRLWSRETPGNAHRARDARQMSSKRQVTRMIIMIVVLFGSCWMPVHIFHLVVTWTPALLRELSPQLVESVYFTCHWLAMSHAFVNPVIYFIMDSEYRHHIGMIFCCKARPVSLTSEVSRATASFHGRSRSSTPRPAPNNRTTCSRVTSRGDTVELELPASVASRENSFSPNEELYAAVAHQKEGRLLGDRGQLPGATGSTIETFFREGGQRLVHAVGTQPMADLQPSTSLVPATPKVRRGSDARQMLRTIWERTMQRPRLHSSVSFDDRLLDREESKEPMLTVTQEDLSASLQCIKSTTRLVVTIPLITVPDIEKQLQISLSPSPMAAHSPSPLWYAEARRSLSSTGSSSSTGLASRDVYCKVSKPSFPSSPNFSAATFALRAVSKKRDGKEEEEEEDGIQLTDVTCQIDET